MSEQNRLVQAAKERHVDPRHVFEGDALSGVELLLRGFQRSEGLAGRGGLATKDPQTCFLEV